ncbi:MAG: hypothetical protein CR986_03555 [Ignavibacteriae bacterium]|nr:MAG: hypothetical protein CR986_03555 [Ignavibacteriota bacterium]
MENIAEHKDKLIKKITSFSRKKLLLQIGTGFIKSLILFIISFHLFSLVETFGYLTPITKFAIWVILILVFIVSFLIFSGSKLKKIFIINSEEEIEKSALEIGSYYKEIKDNLINILQINKTKNSNSDLLSVAAFKLVYDKIKNYNFLSLINKITFYKNSKILAVILIFSFLLFFTFNSYNKGAVRLLKFNTEFIRPDSFKIISLTGNKKIEKGGDIEIKFKIEGALPESVQLFVKSVTDAEVKQKEIIPDSSGIIKYYLSNISASFDYFAKEKKIKSKLHKIEVLDFPVINSMSFKIIPPKYSRIPIFTQNNDGNITSLKGSKVKFNLTSTKELLEAYIIFGESSESLKVLNQKIEGSFTLSKNQSYHFQVLDIDSLSNKNPIEYSINITEDLYPEISIEKPEQISLVPVNDLISIHYNIQDDFGFTKAELKYSLNESFESINLISLNVNKVNIKQNLFYNWDLTQLGLKENQTLNFYIEVFDNDFVSGPKSTKTNIYKLRVPSLEELFAETNKLQENAIEEMTETLKEAENLEREIQNITDELKKNKEKIDWNEKERIKESIEKFQSLTDKVEEVKKKLNKMQREMAENNLLSEETMKKYNELQDLMNSFDNEELKKALQKMQNTLEKLNRNDVQKSLENFSMNEEIFKKSIERTLNLLKKIQIEQKVDEVIKKTKELNEKLNDLISETKNKMSSKNSKETDELKNEQNKVSKKLNDLQKKMNDLQKKMSEFNEMPSDEMKEINKRFDEQNNQKLSEQAMQNIEQENKDQVLQNQKQLSKNMNSLSEQLQNMQKQMQQNNQRMVMQNMIKSIQNVIQLSKEQEKLNNETKNSSNLTSSENLNKQLELKDNLNSILKQMSDLSQKTFAITPEMGKALGDARMNMNYSITGMQNNNGMLTSANQGEAMSNLNKAAKMLQNSLQSMMQGQGAGAGMMSLMQQLKKMGRQQMGINKMTQMLKSGQLTMQQQAQIQRLAQEQAAIGKSLQELNKEAKEAGKSKKLVSNLDKILDEMKEVISGMNTKKIDDNLIRKQERILSRLLDAQTSINERDFEKNRESLSGKNFNLKSPEELNLYDEKTKDILREELLRAVKEGYSKDYQELIKRYFESLEEKKN